MDATESSAAHAHPPSEDQDHRDHDPHADDDHRDPDTQDQDQRHCVCYQRLVYIGCLVVGDDGEEVEVFESVPYRRCAEGK